MSPLVGNALHENTIRDPLYGPITLDPTARALIDTAVYQRLRRIRQLGEASVVYPSAVHTRFEHAVGVYHLAKSIVRQLADRRELVQISAEEIALVPLAALLHDLGHFRGAHLLEEFGYPGVCHEQAGAALFASGEIGEILASIPDVRDAARQIGELVQHQGEHPLGGIVSGACDADKLDYLVRDAYHCGLAAGFDQQHLCAALTVVTNPASGRPEIGLAEGGLTSFEQLLYAKNMLYRTVYFHPTVRAATVMLRALIIAAHDAELFELDELQEWTDDEVFTMLRARIARRRKETPTLRLVETLVERLMVRRLYKCAASLPRTAAPPLTPEAIREAESRLAAELGGSVGEVLLDIPRKPSMLSTDILVRRVDGRVVPADALTPEDGFALPVAKAAFYAAAGRIGLYTATRCVASPILVARVLARVADAS